MTNPPRKLVGGYGRELRPDEGLSDEENTIEKSLAAGIINNLLEDGEDPQYAQLSALYDEAVKTKR